MDLVDRYVHAVKRHLPAAQQDDIVNELTDDILSQISDKEAALGRPLDEAEQEAVLKQYGHPYLLAMRYRPQQHLIGPAVFPFYWTTLKVTLAIALGVHLVVVVATGLSQNEPHRILPSLGFLSVAIHSFFWVTLVFAALDFSQARLHLLDKWSPRSLPRVTAQSPRVNRAKLIGELLGGVVFLGWWLAVPQYPFLMLGPAASFLTLSPAWHRMYLSAAMPSVVSILMGAAVLALPSRTTLAKVRPLVVNLMTLIALSVLTRAGNLLMPVTDTPDLVHMVNGINRGITLVLIIISIVTVIATVVEVIRLIRTEAATDMAV
jgi:hypothetical protein